MSFQRIVKVTASGSGGGVTFDGSQTPNPGFNIEFSCSKSIGSKQNTGQVTIWNLAKGTRNKFGEEFDKISVEIGYKDEGSSLLFSGNIRDVTHSKSSPDISSLIEIGDGDKGIGKGAVSKTHPKGTKPADIIKHLVQQMPDVKLGELKGLDDLPAFKRPVSVFGYAFRELDEMGRHFGFYWSIQNGIFQAVKNDQHLGGDFLISKETGMIGVAEPTDKGVKFKALANPKLIPGKTVKVKSGFLDEGSGRDKRDSDAGGGVFRIASANFAGSTRGDEFYVDIEANRVQGKKVVK